MTTIKINEEYASLVPQLSKSDYQTLKEGIDLKGIQIPIIINEQGEILDGHHRYKIHVMDFERSVQDIPYIVKHFDSKPEEKLFVITTNVERRQLNDFQKAIAAEKIEFILKEISKQNSLANLKQNNSSNNIGSDRSDDLNLKLKQLPTSSNEPLGPLAIKVAKSVGLSAATYKRAKYIIENGNVHQKQLCDSGKSEINTIYKHLRNEEIRQQKIQNAKEDYTTIILLPDGKADLRFGDFREKLSDIPDNSVRLIFTDPPYKKESLPLYKDLAALAARVLKPGGSIVLYIGGYELPDVLDHMRNDSGGGLLKYCFFWYVKHNGGLVKMWGYKMTIDGKLLLWFVKGTSPEYCLPTRQFIESTPPDKSVHDWAQSSTEAEYIISNLSVENELVLDPYMGSGTTGLAALKLNRKFVGVEIDKDHFDNAKYNIAKSLAGARSS